MIMKMLTCVNAILNFRIMGLTWYPQYLLKIRFGERIMFLSAVDPIYYDRSIDCQYNVTGWVLCGPMTWYLSEAALSQRVHSLGK